MRSTCKDARLGVEDVYVAIVWGGDQISSTRMAERNQEILSFKDVEKVADSGAEEARMTGGAWIS